MKDMDIEYIRKDNAVKNLVHDTAYAAANMILEMPAEDVVPVVHARWIHCGFRYGISTWKCNKCERKVQYNGDYILIAYPYCHCGAKMDGGKEDG